MQEFPEHILIVFFFWLLGTFIYFEGCFEEYNELSRVVVVFVASCFDFVFRYESSCLESKLVGFM